MSTWEGFWGGVEAARDENCFRLEACLDPKEERKRKKKHTPQELFPRVKLQHLRPFQRTAKAKTLTPSSEFCNVKGLASFEVRGHIYNG